MEKIIRSHLAICILILVLVSAIFVFAGDVTVKQGTVEGEVFKSTGCTVEATKAVAFGEGAYVGGDYSMAVGYNTEATGIGSVAIGYGTIACDDYATAMGAETTASGWYSTAMGFRTTASGMVSIATGASTTASGVGSTAMGNGTLASGNYSTAMGSCTTASQFCTTAAGYWTEATANYATAFGKYSTNNVANSFTVGYGSSSANRKVDFRVEHQAQQDAVVTVGDITNHNGDLYVGHNVDANTYTTHSSFYDKDTYGRALNYTEDCSRTIKIGAEGGKEYNHEADPEFLKTWVTVKDYDKYTDKKVWNEESQEYEPDRIYETHQELRTDLGMQVAWLRQCVYELKQENDQLKAELAAIKAKLGMQ